LFYGVAAGNNAYEFNDFGSNYDVFIHSLGLTDQIGTKLEYGFEGSLLNLNIGGAGVKECSTAYAQCP